MGERLVGVVSQRILSTIMSDKRRYYEREGGGGGGDFDNNRVSRGGDRESGSGHADELPNSRLFILCGKTVSEEELRASFEPFGTINELWIVKDKSSGDSKGVAYITYSKTSEAAIALEEMNGKFIGNNSKSLKVLIANSRDQGSRRDTNEEERYLRLFIIVPKSVTEAELREHFEQFGEVEHVNIVRNRNTKENKGYAYIKFRRLSHAAKALEGCDRSFKPVFAEPRPPKLQAEDRYTSSHGSSAGNYDLHERGVPELSYPSTHSQIAVDHLHPGSQIHHGAQLHSANRLTVLAHGSLNQDQLWRLCDFFPGLDYCNVRHEPKSRQCYASVVYNSAQAASYAREKLHGFEYPPGHRLIVKFDSTLDLARPGPLLGPVMKGRYNMSTNGNSGGSHGGALVPSSRAASALSPDLATLAETIAQATSIIQAAGLSAGQGHGGSHNSSGGGVGESYDPSYCSVKLPPPQPLAPMDSTVQERLFIVCHQNPPPMYALKDVFGRFGNLIDIYLLNGKNFGYAKYACKGSAEEARNTLHGQEICGMRLKVFKAEPQDHSKHLSSDQKSKRLKVDMAAGDEEIS